MPLIGGLHILIAVALAIHAMKTGRPFWWLYILLAVPALGAAAYVVIELIPEMARSRRARRLAGDIGTIIDPDREWRERLAQAEQVDSVDTKLALAEECERRENWPEAIRLYKLAATGVFADDPGLRYRLARARLGARDPNGALDVLDRLKADHPDFDSKDAHLVYARALEAAGRTDEALHEYEALNRSAFGFEARTRHALLLLKEGWPKDAMRLFGEVDQAARRPRVPLTPNDKDWVKVARAQLR